MGSGYALVVGVFGFVSALLGGAAADGLAARAPPERREAARALVPAAGSLVAAPLWVLALQAPSYGIAIALLAAEFLVAECWIGPTTALLQQAVPAASRGAAQGCFTALTLVGGLAPLAVGAAVDRSDGGLELVPAVAAAVAAAYAAVSSLLFLVAAGLLDDDGAGRRVFHLGVDFFRAGTSFVRFGGGGAVGAAAAAAPEAALGGGPGTGAGAGRSRSSRTRAHRAARVGLDGDEAEDVLGAQRGEGLAGVQSGVEPQARLRERFEEPVVRGRQALSLRRGGHVNNTSRPA